jgi:hypothetical protein
METTHTTPRAALLLAALALACNCGKGSTQKQMHPVDETPDGSVDKPDAAEPDGGAPDGGNLWEGSIEFGTPGPWPTAPVTLYGSAQGIQESNIVDVGTDEAQNLWAATHEAIYVMRPGESRFGRYTAADGLSLANAFSPGITALTGGAPNEAFVGYQGSEVIDPQHDADRFRGKLDRVQLQPDGTLKVTFYNVHNNDALGFDENGEVIRLPDGSPDPQYTDWSYNENRTVLRFLYDHVFHRGSLYVGYNHSVGRIDAGRPDPLYGFDYADHVHPDVTNSEGTKRMGDWNALGLDPFPRTTKDGELRDGMLWMGGRWTAGARHWTPGLWEWTSYRENPFRYAFTSPPVFPVAEGDDVYLVGIAALGDGTVYFASGPIWGFSSPRGIAVMKDARFTYLCSAVTVEVEVLLGARVGLAVPLTGLGVWEGAAVG